MAAIHLSHAVGGNILLGFISAVAFATILAVVSGLTLAGASAISHDLYANAFLKGKQNERNEMFVSKFATVFLGILSIYLGIIFQHQNVAFMVEIVLVKKDIPRHVQEGKGSKLLTKLPPGRLG